MKITINGTDYYISWMYNEFVGKQTKDMILVGITATCTIRKHTEKPKEGDKAENPVILQKSVTENISGYVTKQTLRNASLNKVINAWTVLTKEQKAYIWKTYIQSQHGNISANKMKLKNIIKLVGQLDEEQKEAIRSKFFDQKITGKLAEMKHTVEEVAHA